MRRADVWDVPTDLIPPRKHVLGAIQKGGRQTVVGRSRYGRPMKRHEALCRRSCTVHAGLV